MRILATIFGLLLALAARGAEMQFNFSDTPAGQLPPKFEPLLAGQGAPGEWKVVMADVPSGFMAFSNQAVTGMDDDEPARVHDVGSGNC